MRFNPTPIAGAYVVELQLIEDERGFFARSYCKDEFIAHGLNPNLPQCNISFNKAKGTLRGMHYQTAPYAEAKLVRCTQGAIYDVIIDLRPESPTFKRWYGVELTAANRNALYIPEGLAHGFQTLQDASEVFYQMCESYHPENSKGVRWDDPAFAITWPLPGPVMSERDRQYDLWKGESC
jgi:dTDP-4-dehydrorhamnose 3,5-epimerase